MRKNSQKNSQILFAAKRYRKTKAFFNTFMQKPSVKAKKNPIKFIKSLFCYFGSFVSKADICTKYT